MALYGICAVAWVFVAVMLAGRSRLPVVLLEPTLVLGHVLISLVVYFSGDADDVLRDVLRVAQRLRVLLPRPALGLGAHGVRARLLCRDAARHARRRRPSPRGS